MDKVTLSVWVYACYHCIRIIIEKGTQITIALLLCYAIVQTFFWRDLFGLYDLYYYYCAMPIELKAACVSSFVTIVGVFLSIVYAARQLKADFNNKRRSELAGNMVSVMHDMSMTIVDVRIFAESTRELLIKAIDADGFGGLYHEFEYWKSQRKEMLRTEERLWSMWHEFNRWCAVGKRHLTILGISKIADTVANFASTIKIRSMTINIWSTGDRPPDLAETLKYVDLYCLDMFIDKCIRAHVYISGNMGRINDILLGNIKEYTVRELLFLARSAKDMRHLLHALQTGEAIGMESITDAYNKTQNIR